MDEKLILVADSQDGVNTIQNILGKERSIISSNSIDEAVALLKKNVCMVICGVHFDECRMFDFLRIAKANSATRNIPFLCFRGLDLSIGLTIFESLHIACKALGAEDFVDLYQLKTQFGSAQADEKLKKIISDIIFANSTIVSNSSH